MYSWCSSIMFHCIIIVCFSFFSIGLLWMGTARTMFCTNFKWTVQKTSGNRFLCVRWKGNENKFIKKIFKGKRKQVTNNNYCKYLKNSIRSSKLSFVAANNAIIVKRWNQNFFSWIKLQIVRLHLEWGE